MTLTIINRKTTSRTTYTGTDAYLDECLSLYLNENNLELSDLIICKRK